jgi:hypothetical protein
VTRVFGRLFAITFAVGVSVVFLPPFQTAMADEVGGEEIGCRRAPPRLRPSRWW